MRHDYELRPYYRELNRIPRLAQEEQQRLLAALSTARTESLSVQAEQAPVKGEARLAPYQGRLAISLGGTDAPTLERKPRQDIAQERRERLVQASQRLRGQGVKVTIDRLVEVTEAPTNLVTALQTVRIYQLTHLSPTLFGRLKTAQMEGAQVWNCCCELHKQARITHSTWPGQNELQQATKGRFALHSQSVQMIAHAFVANIEATRHLRATHPKMRMKYPWKTKRFYPVHWPAQAVSRERGRVVLPMGRGRASLVLPLDLPEHSGACTLVWNRGFELHVCIEVPQATHAPGTSRATVDLGEIVRREVA